MFTRETPTINREPNATMVNRVYTECERSACTLRRLYMGITMGIELISYFALLHVHNNKAVDFNNVVNISSKLRPHHFALTSLC